MDDGVQLGLCGYARRVREELELDLLRGRMAGIPLGSCGGVDGIDTGADDGASTSSIGGQKGRGVVKLSG